MERTPGEAERPHEGSCPQPAIPSSAKEDLPRAIEHAIRRYYQKDYQPMLCALAPDCVWLGAGNMLYFGRDELLPDLEREAAGPAFTMRNEAFWPIDTGHDDLALVMGVYDLHTDASERTICAVRQRATVMCRLVEGAWLCQHVHVSNEWGELEDDELFPYAVSRQTYQYVQRIVKTAQRMPAAARGRIELKLAGASRLVDPDRIVYIEARRKECAVHFADAQQDVRMSIGELEQILPADFVRVHRSYIVNRNQVRSIERCQVELADGTRLPVPGKRFGEVRRRIVGGCGPAPDSPAPAARE